MRRILVLVAALAVTLAVAGPASADTRDVGNVAVGSKITSFSAQNGRLIANGTLKGSFTSLTGDVTRTAVPVRFRVFAAQAGRCDVLRLRLAPLTLELLGARVETSTITLEIYARRREGLLGQLFCALANRRVSLPRLAASLNREIADRPMRAFNASAPVRVADHQGSCQVLRLVLGPLRLNLLGLHVELFGARRRDPVTVTITALPGHGLLGDLLCGLAGGPLPVPPPLPVPLPTQ